MLSSKESLNPSTAFLKERKCVFDGRVCAYDRRRKINRDRRTNRAVLYLHPAGNQASKTQRGLCSTKWQLIIGWVCMCVRGKHGWQFNWSFWIHTAASLSSHLQCYLSSSSSPPSSSPLQSLAPESECALRCPSPISLLSVCPSLPWTQHRYTTTHTSSVAFFLLSLSFSFLLPLVFLFTAPPPYLLPLLFIKSSPSPLCLLLSAHLSKLHSKHRRGSEEGRSDKTDKKGVLFMSVCPFLNVWVLVYRCVIGVFSFLPGAI